MYNQISDLLLRQYKRVRDGAAESGDRKKSFVYKDIKPVYTIIFYEKSPKAFHEKDQLTHFLHHAEYKANTGVTLNLLQHFYFIPLDIFQALYDNKNADTELTAWLMFLSTDDPEAICRLIDTYPYFETLYKDVYELAANKERVMEMFSKELQELDEGTTQYMIDELTDEVNELRSENATLLAENKESENKLKKLEAELAKRGIQIASLL